MCIHLSFVIRLPVATEADPVDVETQGLDSTHHARPVTESMFDQNKQKTPRAKDKSDAEMEALFLALASMSLL